MTNIGKVIVISVGALLAICLCLGVAGVFALQGTGRLLARTIETDPETVAAASDAIADYITPAGFDQGSAVTIAGFAMITHTGDDGRSHIYLIQEPSWLELDQADLERQMRQASGTEEWTEVSVVEKRPCQIRGQETVLVVSEGVSHDEQRYRSASAFFQGKGGLALLNISTPAESWDAEIVQNFIETIE